ncbi:phage regulatory CII family protein [Nitrosomonas sp. Nm34]|uniref:phage regulatory CII family protein n=1 Tax=Nitrosomonas sp. Nm34 TaxID=1881055 RepID=UPI0008F32D7E|nr:phage regulatory CII family protein [Nitrosomonas sp. Nm34]SFI31009.1 hypothetical protein SAMN05428978_100543 [Nitrosomonas sp. Nm34]
MKQNIKNTHRALFLALQAGAKRYPGGIKALAEVIELNGSTLANGINPDHDCPPPTFATIIEIISLAQCKEAVFYINQLVGCVPVDVEIANREAEERTKTVAVLSVMAKASDVIAHGSEALKDGRIDASECQQILQDLQNLLEESTSTHSILRK